MSSSDSLMSSRSQRWDAVGAPQRTSPELRGSVQRYGPRVLRPRVGMARSRAVPLRHGARARERDDRVSIRDGDLRLGHDPGRRWSSARRRSRHRSGRRTAATSCPQRHGAPGRGNRDRRRGRHRADGGGVRSTTRPPVRGRSGRRRRRPTTAGSPGSNAASRRAGASGSARARRPRARGRHRDRSQHPALWRT